MRVKRANRTPPRTDCGRARQKGRNYRYAGAVSCDVSQQADLTDYVDVEQVSDCVGICSAGQSRGLNAIAHVSGQETQPLLLTPSQQIHHRYAYMYFDPGFPNYGQCQVFKCRKITLY